MWNSTLWRINSTDARLKQYFASLDQVFSVQGEKVTAERISDLLRVRCGDEYFYVKRYFVAGKGMRRWFGKPRIQSEWENLLWFSEQGIPTAEVVAMGLQRRRGLFLRGAMVTREIPQTRDLATLARNNDPLLADAHMVHSLSQQAADILNNMHASGFVHNDFKWRNLLVDQAGKLYVIDCPLGRFWFGPLLRYRMIKELAMLDRVAKYKLRATQRLRFFLLYRQTGKLRPQDKKVLRRLLGRKERRKSSFAVLAT